MASSAFRRGVYENFMRTLQNRLSEKPSSCVIDEKKDKETEKTFERMLRPACIRPRASDIVDLENRYFPEDLISDLVFEIVDHPFVSASWEGEKDVSLAHSFAAAVRAVLNVCCDEVSSVEAVHGAMRIATHVVDAYVEQEKEDDISMDTKTHILLRSLCTWLVSHGRICRSYNTDNKMMNATYALSHLLSLPRRNAPERWQQTSHRARRCFQQMVGELERALVSSSQDYSDESRIIVSALNQVLREKEEEEGN